MFGSDKLGVTQS